jgi:hypothetical protein
VSDQSYHWVWVHRQTHFVWLYRGTSSEVIFDKQLYVNAVVGMLVGEEVMLNVYDVRHDKVRAADRIGSALLNLNHIATSHHHHHHHSSSSSGGGSDTKEWTVSLMHNKNEALNHRLRRHGSCLVLNVTVHRRHLPSSTIQPVMMPSPIKVLPSSTSSSSSSHPIHNNINGGPHPRPHDEPTSIAEVIPHLLQPSRSTPSRGASPLAHLPLNLACSTFSRLAQRNRSITAQQRHQQQHSTPPSRSTLTFVSPPTSPFLTSTHPPLAEDPITADSDPTLMSVSQIERLLADAEKRVAYWRTQLAHAVARVTHAASSAIATPGTTVASPPPQRRLAVVPSPSSSSSASSTAPTITPADDPFVLNPSLHHTSSTAVPASIHAAIPTSIPTTVIDEPLLVTPAATPPPLFRVPTPATLPLTSPIRTSPRKAFSPSTSSSLSSSSSSSFPPSSSSLSTTTTTLPPIIPPRSHMNGGHHRQNSNDQPPAGMVQTIVSQFEPETIVQTSQPSALSRASSLTSSVSSASSTLSSPSSSSSGGSLPASPAASASSSSPPTASSHHHGDPSPTSSTSSSPSTSPRRHHHHHGHGHAFDDDEGVGHSDDSDEDEYEDRDPTAIHALAVAAAAAAAATPPPPPTLSSDGRSVAPVLKRRYADDSSNNTPTAAASVTTPTSGVTSIGPNGELIIDTISPAAPRQRRVSFTASLIAASGALTSSSTVPASSPSNASSSAGISPAHRPVPVSPSVAIATNGLPPLSTAAARAGPPSRALPPNPAGGNMSPATTPTAASTIGLPPMYALPTAPSVPVVVEEEKEDPVTMSEMVRGKLFTMFFEDSRHKPSMKTVFFQSTASKWGSLFWCDPGVTVTNSNNEVALHLVRDILIGKDTSAFKQKQAKGAIEECCFSLVYDGNTMDLEISTANGGRPLRDRWVAELRKRQRRLLRAESQNSAATGAAFLLSQLTPRAVTTTTTTTMSTASTIVAPISSSSLAPAPSATILSSLAPPKRVPSPLSPSSVSSATPSPTSNATSPSSSAASSPPVPPPLHRAQTPGTALLSTSPSRGARYPVVAPPSMDDEVELVVTGLRIPFNGTNGNERTKQQQQQHSAVVGLFQRSATSWDYLDRSAVIHFNTDQDRLFEYKMYLDYIDRGQRLMVTIYDMGNGNGGDSNKTMLGSAEFDLDNVITLGGQGREAIFALRNGTSSSMDQQLVDTSASVVVRYSNRFALADRSRASNNSSVIVDQTTVRAPSTETQQSIGTKVTPSPTPSPSHPPKKPLPPNPPAAATTRPPSPRNGLPPVVPLRPTSPLPVATSSSSSTTTTTSNGANGIHHMHQRTSSDPPVLVAVPPPLYRTQTPGTALLPSSSSSSVNKLAPLSVPTRRSLSSDFNGVSPVTTPTSASTSSSSNHQRKGSGGSLASLSGRASPTPTEIATPEAQSNTALVK